MHIIKQSEIYQSRAKSGLLKFWRIFILADNNNGYYTQTEAWQETKGGGTSKPIRSEPYYALPTNVGRANERDSLAQAHFEYDSIIQTQRDKKKYRLPHEPENVRPGAMLAHKFPDHKHKIQYPVFVQPKFNGRRMLFDGRAGWTRGNKEVLPAVLQHLTITTPEPLPYLLDGELLLPGMKPLQKSSSAITKFQPGVSDTLCYVVYDIVDPSRPYGDRYLALTELFRQRRSDIPTGILLAPTTVAHTEHDILEFQRNMMAQGHEGTIVRTNDTGYEPDVRSYSLLKLKSFEDAEFRIVDIVPAGGGIASDMAKFICLAENGETFEVTPEGSHDYRRQLLTDRVQYIGRYAQVRFPERSERAVPLYAVGMDIRDAGDF